MIQPLPSATYRVQLRDGVTFASVEQQLEHIKGLGISHLYLSPIFTASTGSTHGYDVLDPTEIEPSLGGRQGFERLARAAHEHGIGIILDIVPNHTAFTLENRWLADVLKHGQASAYAPYFDIDWSAGPLVLPLLPEPFGIMLEKGAFSISGGNWTFGEVSVPLAADTDSDTSSSEALAALHDQQHWRLVHWELERDGITHRRFFNVTSLIGMRVEDPAVFDATHRLIIDLVQSGLVDGLRVDHIDGLANPRAYLERLAQALPYTPIWVEKILVGREALDPEWKTVGTTGYEAARLIARLLTDGDGVDRLDEHWRAYTGIEEDFATALATAKLDILQNELAAELHQLCALAAAALAPDRSVQPGPEGLREAVVQLLAGMTRYRTYIDADGAGSNDRALLDNIVENAKGKIRSSRIIERLVVHLAHPESPADQRLAVRFQQVSGALLAKAQEDTAGFRWTRYIAANEVGAEPEEPTVSDDEANAFLATRRPSEMTLTSTHDTKRSEDSRMRLVAISHHPDAFRGLVDDADKLAGDDLSPRWRWYIIQSILALWGDDIETLKQRLHQHNQKALREAKLESFWTRPDEPLEAAADSFVDAVCQSWHRTEPADLRLIIDTGAALSLVQVALKCLLPGFPDIYRGGEVPFFALTDPDNRLPFDWTTIESLAARDTFTREKLDLTRALLALRHDEADFFVAADARLNQDNGLVLTRSHGGRKLELAYGGSPTGIPFIKRVLDGKTLTITWSES